MTTKSIGIFAFGTSPIAHMAPLRTRALLGEAALQDVELFFFSAADCDMPRREIEATYWTSSGWAKRRAPLPGLVLVVTDPIRPRHHEIDQWLRGHSRVIADHAPDKLDLGRFLLGTPLAGYVIPCAPLEAEGAETAIAGWASEHGAAIVKPIDGMRGGGIHFIGKGDDGRWLAAVGEERTEGTLAEAANWIVERISGRMGYRRYLVQQYIRSTTAEGRPAALRADVQKKPEGGWGLIRGVVRFGEVDRLITNMARGGYQGPPDGFLSRRRVRPAAELAEEYVSVGLRTAELLDGSGQASIVELGVDFAIDPNDKLWLIEANARPDNPATDLDRAIDLIAYLRTLAD